MAFNQQQNETYKKAAFLCSKFERCSNKVRQKLMDWGLSEEETEPVIKKLISEKYIDDRRYAHSFVRDKFRFNRWGKIKIAYQLRADRIVDSIIEDALTEIDDQSYQALLVKLLSEKALKIKTVSTYEQKAKLLRFAQSRGFESDLIFRELQKIVDD